MKFSKYTFNIGVNEAIYNVDDIHPVPEKLFNDSECISLGSRMFNKYNRRGYQCVIWETCVRKFQQRMYIK